MKPRILILALLVFASSPSLQATDKLNCADVHSIKQMILSNSIDDLRSAWKKSNKNFPVTSVFNFRYYELRRHDPGAVGRLFDGLPTNDQRYGEWTSMGDSWCENESIEDMRQLDGYESSFPRLLSQAVVDFPGEMHKYLNIVMLANSDPHTTFPDFVGKVCASRKYEFISAVNKLKESKWFSSHVINPSNCLVIHHEETDD